MPKPIIINSSHYVAGSRNKFRYTFPSNVLFNKNAKIGLQSLSMFNSTFNISSAFGNNKFTIIWNANATTVYNITIPDGYYSASDLNFFLQSQLIANKLYMIEVNGNNNVYFTEIVTNSVRYSLQINTYPLPTTAQASSYGFVLPSGATWSLPSSAKSPQITINSGLGDLLGFKEMLTFPSASTITTASNFLSDKTPVISPVSSYLLTLNLLNSEYCIPNNLFYAVPLGSTAFGRMLQVGNNTIAYTEISAGHYREIMVTLLDQDFNPLLLNDLEFTLILSLDTGEN